MKSRLLNTVSACILAATSFSENALSDVIIDPNNLGDTNVYPGNLESSPGNALLIAIGTSAGSGEVEVNANALVNGYTRIRSTGSLLLGGGSSLGSGKGVLRIIGNGSAGSASALANRDVAVGTGADSLIEIRNGGLVSGSNIQLGSSSTSDADIIVDGINSRLQATSGSINFSGQGTGLTRSVMVSNGASIGASGAQYGSTLGIWRDDSITVTGAGSSATFETTINNAGNINVLNGGLVKQVEVPGLIDGWTNPGGFRSLYVGDTEQPAVVTISGTDTNGNASRVSVTRNAQIGGFNQYDYVLDGNGNYQLITKPTSGTMVVENGGIFNADGNVLVSETGTGGNGTLTIRNGGQVVATSVTILEGGLLNGNGGTIAGNLIVDGGTVSPGNSPGTLTINGNLDYVGGSLEIEIAGTSAGQFDELKVLGAATFESGTTIILKFINGFAPSANDAFDFLLAGTFTGDMSLVNFVVSGLKSGFEFNTGFTGSGAFNITALNDGVSAVPAPAAVWLFGSGLIGLAGIARKRKVA